MSKRCWTCGTHVENWSYTCPSCQPVKELQELRKSVQCDVANASPENTTKFYCFGFPVLRQIQLKAFTLLEEKCSERFSDIASAVEWGFGEIEWQLVLQTEALHHLDDELNMPGQIQANEWRHIAEKLRVRGVLEESEEFYLKALDLNRLDYRMYAGLAETYLQGNQFDKARNFLEKSLPHAPAIPNFDYKCYSYRLLGHIYACEENYREAFTALRSSIELSPNYTDGCYDYAQYAVFVDQKEESLNSLQKAIVTPLYFSLAQTEKNFDPMRGDVQSSLFRIGLTRKLSVQYFPGLFALAKYWAKVGNTQSCLSLLNQLINREPGFFEMTQSAKALEPLKNEVQQLLSTLKSEAFHKAEKAVNEAENALNAVKETVSEVKQTADRVGVTYVLKSDIMYKNAETTLQRARDMLNSGSYVELLEVVSIAEQAVNLGIEAKTEVDKEWENNIAHRVKHRSGRRSKKSKTSYLKFWKLLDQFIFWPIIIGLIFAAIEVFIAVFIAISYTVFFGGIFVGIFIGILIGIQEEGNKIKKFFRHTSLGHKLKFSNMFRRQKF
ncbi:Tfp pilus assembly protein PilF [Candidatus Vecturithrix granuli]|uniref:Tfp pilus assembly protein PilF n=1 Tax=Vecturithrix granuli TaxID=1499967 RepID=A0A081BUQ7_VECG1|nr:Tfp pilus assembly protein PilF [Candidatus Vecturithrix granuli]